MKGSSDGDGDEEESGAAADADMLAHYPLAALLQWSAGNCTKGWQDWRCVCSGAQERIRSAKPTDPASNVSFFLSTNCCDQEDPLCFGKPRCVALYLNHWLEP